MISPRQPEATKGGASDVHHAPSPAPPRSPLTSTSAGRIPPLDLEPTDRTRDEEVERLLGIGAVQVADHRRPDGSGWVVLADPEGNGFCVLRSAPERAATAG